MTEPYGDVNWRHETALSVNAGPIRPEHGETWPAPSVTMTAVCVSIDNMPLRARLTWGCGWLLGMTIGQPLAALFPSRIWHFGHITVDGWRCRLIRTVKR